MPSSPPPSSQTNRDFRLSTDALVSLAETERVDFRPDVVELPRFYGAPLLFAIARGPRTIFAYWSVDWMSIFANIQPVDRQVHLRVHRTDGQEEVATAAEPMAGNCYIEISRPRATYRAELGFYQPQDVWHAVATSNDVTMPPENVAERTDVDLATIPLHLSFQRLIDLFRGKTTDALARIIARLQERAGNGEDDALSPEELSILQAMDVSLEDVRAARVAFGKSAGAPALRHRAEAILGFGASSPRNAFGSNWS